MAIPEGPGAAARVPQSHFPIVGIGMSAGGLEAVSSLLEALSHPPGMAFVLVPHLDPRHESRLVELLARTTEMPVLEAADGLRVEPNRLCVIAPNTNLTIAQGTLRVTLRSDAHPHRPIDVFLKSLADEQQTHAIGVLLSGTGSDGTRGLCEIKAVGGITFVQDERSAKHFWMPRSAIDQGCVDAILPPNEIARRLRRIRQHPYDVLSLSAPSASETAPPAALEQELQRLRHELAAAKEQLQSIIEQQDTTHEELRSANEEVVSSNQELQSANEELQTAQEELQSTNEELRTVNEHLRNRNSELALATNDLSNLLTSTNLPLVMIGADLRIRRLTPAARRVLNLLPTDVGRPIDHIRPSVDIPPLSQLIEQVIRTVRVWRADVQDRDGCWWTLRIHPYRASDHRIDGAVIILVDVDEIKRFAEKLRNAQDVGGLGSWELDVATGRLECSEHCRSICGLSSTTGSGYEDLLRTAHPEDGARVRAEMTRAVDTRTDYNTEYRVLWPDGSEHWLISRGAAAYDGQGRPIRVAGMILDISERKRMETALRDADRRKDEFLALLAHELRNPLAPLRLAVQAMATRGDEPTHDERRLQVMNRHLTHLTRIIDDLLDVSRVTYGRIELRTERVALSDILNLAIETTRPVIDEARHTLSVTLPELPIFLNADPVRLAQAVSNLLDNAAKFTPPGGHVWLAAERRQDRDERIGDVVISVRDDGVGIRAELLPHVFEMFAQGQHPLERTQGGLGVGLALARQLVRMHGGTIQVKSDGPDRGSELAIRLPIVPAPAHEEAQVASSDIETPHETSLRILVVDDYQDAVEMLEALLSSMGHEVRTAIDGPGALDAFADFGPDVVLLDIGLPGVNGYDVARRIRRKAVEPRPVLMAITGWGQERDRRQSADAGFDHHLVKPVNVAVLTELIGHIQADRATPHRRA